MELTIKEEKLIVDIIKSIKWMKGEKERDLGKTILIRGNKKKKDTKLIF